MILGLGMSAFDTMVVILVLVVVVVVVAAVSLTPCTGVRWPVDSPDNAESAEAGLSAS